MTIRAVVFDIGGVLESVDDARWPQAWLSRWADIAGADLNQALDYLQRHEPTDGALTGTFSEADFRRVYTDALGLGFEQLVDVIV